MINKIAQNSAKSAAPTAYNNVPCHVEELSELSNADLISVVGGARPASAYLSRNVTRK